MAERHPPEVVGADKAASGLGNGGERGEEEDNDRYSDGAAVRNLAVSWREILLGIAIM